MICFHSVWINAFGGPRKVRYSWWRNAVKKNRRKLNIQHLLPLDIAPASQTKTINKVYAMNMKKKDSVTGNCNCIAFFPLKIFSEPYIGVLFCSTTRKFMTIRLPFCVLFLGSCISDQTVKLGSADQIWIKVLLLYKYESRFCYCTVYVRCFQKRCVLFRYIMRTSGRQVENGCGGDREGLTCTNMHIDIH